MKYVQKKFLIKLFEPFDSFLVELVGIASHKKPETN